MKKKNKLILDWWKPDAQPWLSDIYINHLHKKWDSLMDIVEKIEGMGYRIEIAENNCDVYKDGGHIRVIEKEATTKILAVHEAVFKFINQIKD